MTEIPSTPREFFTTYLPARFAAARQAFSGKSSPGSMTFHVHGDAGGSWTLSLANGELEVTPGTCGEPVVQAFLSREDFEHLLLQAARLEEAQGGGLETQLLAFKALTLDAERAKMLRSVTGSVAFVIADGSVTRKVVIAVGDVRSVEQPDCRVECQVTDFLDLTAGRQLAIQLAMSGRMRLLGNAQVAMALGAVFM
ncbi:MAG: SCP2 sterol-binding domain-containing protein [Deltaproteobacteria bacterium]|nr:SCP2 sterol-binding domain-containing protein [Deltaproteobacteria bacterium]